MTLELVNGSLFSPFNRLALAMLRLVRLFDCYGRPFFQENPYDSVVARFLVYPAQRFDFLRSCSYDKCQYLKYEVTPVVPVYPVWRRSN